MLPRRLIQYLRIDRFRQMVIHPGIKRVLPLLVKGVGGHRNDRNVFCVCLFQYDLCHIDVQNIVDQSRQETYLTRPIY